MWDHRNGILKNDPERHMAVDELTHLNSSIAAEWEIGDAGLMAQDRYLFRDQEAVLNKTIPNKHEWLTSVTLAREAAVARAEQQDTHAQERQSLRNWLLPGSNRTRDGSPTQLHTNNNPETTNNSDSENTETLEATSKNNALEVICNPEMISQTSTINFQNIL